MLNRSTRSIRICQLVKCYCGHSLCYVEVTDVDARYDELSPSQNGLGLCDLDRMIWVWSYVVTFEIISDQFSWLRITTTETGHLRADKRTTEMMTRGTSWSGWPADGSRCDAGFHI